MRNVGQNQSRVCGHLGLERCKPEASIAIYLKDIVVVVGLSLSSAMSSLSSSMQFRIDMATSKWGFETQRANERERERERNCENQMRTCKRQ